MAALARTMAYHRDPLGVLRRLRARHGPVFALELALKGPVCFVAAPDAVDELLAADPGRAHAGEARRTVLPQASPLSPFGADGTEHHATRRRMAPAFAPEAMERL